MRTLTMKQILFSLAALFTIIISSAHAQKRTEHFEIDLPAYRVSNSLYNSIGFLDSRMDTTSLGIIQKGAFNKPARVVPKSKISERLQELLDNLVDSDAKQGELLFQLRNLQFRELTGAMSERGFCQLHATIYAKQDNNYYRINDIDTIIVVKAVDVTKKLFRTTSGVLHQFLTSSVAIDPPSIPAYTFADVAVIDSIEKRIIPLYNTDHLQNGLYRSYASFAKNTPDETDLSIKENGGTIVEASLKNAEGKYAKLSPKKDMYAIVHNGTPFIATQYGYFLLEKIGDDFYFIGRDKATTDAGSVMAASFLFGIVGGLIASSPDNVVVEFKIKHTDGNFIAIREVARL